MSTKGENVIPKLIEALEQEKVSHSNYFGLATSSSYTKKSSIDELKAKKMTASSACGYIVTKSNTVTQPFVLKTENETVTFDGRAFLEETHNAMEKEIKSYLQADSIKSVDSILKHIEGEFAVIINQEDGVVAARDPIGVQPLYYGTNVDFTALASNRKALWHIGIDQTKSFPPGNVAVFSKSGCKFQPSMTLEFERPKSTTMDEAAATLRRLLETSVRKRVSDQKKVSVAFSGGLDSSVVAWLTKKTGVETQLIHVSLENQPETDEAKKAAAALDLPLSVHLFTEKDVEKDICKVIQLVEDTEPITVSVGLPFYWNAQNASKAGFQVMLAGQGADELFGGYLRYVKEYISKGDEAYRRTMFHDITTIHESNIERDEKVCNFWDIELRLPFGSYEIAKFALTLPTSLKFEKSLDSPRKLVLRRTAEIMGIPNEIVEKPKKAVQYSTGTSALLKKIAKKHNLSLSEYVRQLFKKNRDSVSR